MKLIGVIKKELLIGCTSVQFIDEEEQEVAFLSMSPKERTSDSYLIRYTISQKENPIFVKDGIFKTSFNIWTSAEEPNWHFGRKSWKDIFTGTRYLTVNSAIFEIHQSSSKYQIYLNDEHVGTAKKQYNSIFENGEYAIALSDEFNEQLAVVICSILAIELEVLAQRGQD